VSTHFTKFLQRKTQNLIKFLTLPVLIISLDKNTASAIGGISSV
jgi:hypothetical protein